MTVERARQLARGRKTAQANREKAAKARRREHKTNDRVYRAAVAAYYQMRRIHGEGSPQERRAWRKMISAEVAWFGTHPGDRS